jgi:serine/threonine protein kinase
MTNSDPYIGQVLDEKYRLERLLGRGGMGSVYLATHLGTERYVALKLITPQFMRNEEFVARFKREARAAGRLRHPNVVDVTDFGFAHAGTEAVAYLVMEYLDGCTLGDVLSEEKRLPLDWVVDILEQVCSAVHEAHQQGIVHRDLKPENIWLEPNRLGGYRVKVLDFGIAKLAEAEVEDNSPGSATGAGAPPPLRSSSQDLEVATLMYDSGEQEQSRPKPDDAGITARFHSEQEKATQVFEPSAVTANATSAVSPQYPTHLVGNDDQTLIPDDDRTLMFDGVTQREAPGQQTRLPIHTTRATELTRVGAIMGTPLYMSPEQCAGKTLDARSDVYSIGVIAYQMLAGETPFAGDTSAVMQEHIKTPPPHLRKLNKKVRKRAADVVMTALSKQPEDRPQSAAAFASSLHARAEGIGSLYRRALVLYSEYFPKFLKISLLAHIPVVISTSLLLGFQIAENSLPRGMGVARVLFVCGMIISGLLQMVTTFLAAAAISGMTAVIVTQVSLAPLRPVELRLAFALLKRRWRPFIKTSLRVTLRIVIGFILLVIPGIVMTVRYALYAPVVLMEGLEKKAAMRRARELASRSWRTVIIVSLLQFMIPIVISAFLGKLTVVQKTQSGLHLTDRSTSHLVYQHLTSLINIIIVPFLSIVPALLYLKMRQLGGENLADALAEIEEADEQRTQWQQRMRTRLSLHPSRGSRGTDSRSSKH